MSTTKMGTANSSIPRRPASLKNRDPTNPLNQLREAHSKFHLECRACKTPSEPHALEANTTAWFSEKGDDHTPAYYCLSACACARCGASTCVGCGLKPNKYGSSASAAATEDTLHNCCEQGKLFGIWMALCRFDEHELEPKEKVESPKVKPKKSKYHKYGLSNGVGYDHGAEWPEDDGFLENNPAVASPTVTLPAEASSTTKIQDDNNASDTYMIETLDLLTTMLLTPSTSSGPSSTQEMLLFFRTSLLMDRVCALVRNDSISDMTERDFLYKEVFTFLETLAGNEGLCQLLFDPQPSRIKSPGLRILSDGSNNDQRCLNFSADQPSVFACSKNTFKQATVFLDISKNIKRGKSKSTSEAQATNMCDMFVEFYGILENTMTVEESERCSTERTKDEWTEFSDQNKVTFTDEVLKNHRFAKSFPSLRHSSKDRMITISKEISNMTTSLPAGVFVKVAESRADVMKVLMIGVEGSPYAGGIFIFDILLPQNYPNIPPKMAFVLEGVDSEAPPMNPNLHPGGSVCLSILNTWSGHESQMWQPGKSTVLAVLVSVQAMILGAPLPLLNEPGLAMLGNSPEVIEHKRHIQVKTVRHAMIAWLVKTEPSTEDKEPDIWKETIDAYWKYNHKAVIDTVEQWSLENSLIKAYDKAYFPTLSMWAGGFGQPPAVKKPVKTVIEDLAQKLEGLISSRFDEGTPTDGSSESRSLDSPEDASNLDTSTSESTSISAGSSTELAEANKKDSNKGKRKETANATETTKEANKKGSKRRKTKTEQDYAQDSDSENLAKDLPGKGKSSTASLEAPVVGSKKGRWIYTSGRSMKEVREACLAFDVTPARSINDSIDRLEDYVNDEEKADHELALKYGKTQKPLK